MKYRYHRANPPLTEYIRTVVVLEDGPGPETADLPLYTKGMAALLCKTENGNDQVTLFGQSVPDEKWVVENNASLIAFFFKPFSIGPIFKLSAKELKDQPVELTQWHAQKALALRLQLVHSGSLEKRIECLEHFLISQVQQNQHECEMIRFVTDKLMQYSDADALSQILKEVNLTERTFQRIFKKYVGTTPNEYRRICQFYFAFTQLRTGDFDSLSDVAYGHGYFDQSHFIRAFKEFTDTTPNEYRQSGLKKGQ